METTTGPVGSSDPTEMGGPPRAPNDMSALDVLEEMLAIENEVSTGGTEPVTVMGENGTGVVVEATLGTETVAVVTLRV